MPGPSALSPPRPRPEAGCSPSRGAFCFLRVGTPDHLDRACASPSSRARTSTSTRMH